MAQTPVTKTLTDLPVYSNTGYAGHLLYTDSNIEYRLPLNSLVRKSELGNSDGFKYIGQVESWADLQSITLTEANVVIKLKSYVAGGALTGTSPSGGGYFISVSGTATDDGGSICVPSGQTNFYLVRIRATDEINLSEYGLVPGGEIAIPLIKAVAYSRSVGITKIVIPPSYGEQYYTWSSQVNVDVTKYPLTLMGGSGENMNEVMVYHYPTATNEVAIDFSTTSAGSSPTEAACICGFYFYNQNTAVNASAIQFSDAWAHKARNLYITHYALSAGIRMVNINSWTENFQGENLNIRHCKYGFWLYTTGSWQSFYGMKLEKYYFNHGSAVGGPSYSMYLGNGTSTGYAFLYAADLDMGGWLGTTYSTGPHCGIYLAPYSIVMGKCRMNYDGTQQASLATYFTAVYTASTQCIARLDFTNNNDQFSYVSIQAPDSASTLSYALWDNLAYPALNGSKTYGRSNWMNVAMARSPIILSGAQQKWKTTVTSTSTTKTDPGIIRVVGLPILSNFKVEIKTSGTNQVCNRTFIVNVHNQDLVAAVTEQQQLSAGTATTSTFNSTTSTVTSISTTTLTQYSSFTNQRVYCRTYNGVQPGYYSAGNGQTFDIVIPPSTYNGTSANADAVVTSGLTTAIEIIITQI